MLDSFLAALRGEVPREVAWTGDITYWISGQKQKGTARPEWDTEEGYLDLHRDLGLMPYYYYPKFFAAEPEYGPGISLASEERRGRTVSRITTSAGELVEEQAYLPESACSGFVEHFVRTEKDLDVLLHLLERRRLVPANLDDYEERRRKWEDRDALPALGLPRSPFASLCCEWAGVENTVYLLADCPGKVRTALELMTAQEEPVLDALCDLAPPLAHFPDNLTSDTVTPFYDEFYAGTHRRRIERLHAAGTRCAVHLDGTVRALLPRLVETGFDAVESLTPAPVGDVDAAGMCDLVGGGHTALWGGVPGAIFSAPYTWDDMARHVESVLEAWRGRPFILGTADQVPPDGDVGFCHRIAEMCGAFTPDS